MPKPSCLCLCLWLAAACTSDDTLPSARELPAELAERTCALDERCNAFPRGTHADCVALRTAMYQDGKLGRLIAEHEAGKASYAPDRAQLCLDGIPAHCDMTGHDLCASAFRGRQRTGETCELDEECSEGSYCNRDSGCPGSCKVLPTLGAPCDILRCAEGLTCLIGATHECVRALRPDDPCGPTKPACERGYDCLDANDQLVPPFADASEQGTCRVIPDVPQVGRGEACDFENGPRCQQGLTCVFEAGRRVGHCEKLAGPGEACPTAATPNPCVANHYCASEADAGDEVATCRPLPGKDEPCSTPTGECAGDALCIDDGPGYGVCRAPGRIGDACSSGAMCASQTCVDHVCRAWDLCELDPIP